MATQARFGTGEAIELGLRGGLEPATALDDQAAAEQLRPVLDRALLLLQDCVLACGDGDAPATHLQDCRNSLYAPSSTGLHDQCLAALEVCRQFLARHDAAQSARHRQLVELVELVRDTLADLSGSATAFDTGLVASAARFDALLSLDSLTQIKVQLTREIGELKRLSEERQRTWTTTVAAFATRISELETQLAATEQQASTDGLTALANRAAFDHALKALAATRGARFVLALLDVDDFKRINDTWGHLAGDQALVTVAHGLKAAFRSDDVVARHGGDEFSLLIKDMTLHQAETRLLGAIDAIAANRPATDTGEILAFTMSGGLAEFSAGDTTRSLLQRADEALYEAKRLGKNRVVRREQVYFRHLRKS